MQQPEALLFQVTRRFRSLSVVAVIVLTLTNVLVSLRLLHVSCPEGSPDSESGPHDKGKAFSTQKAQTPPLKKHVTKPVNISTAPQGLLQWLQFLALVFDFPTLCHLMK